MRKRCTTIKWAWVLMERNQYKEAHGSTGGCEVDRDDQVRW